MQDRTLEHRDHHSAHNPAAELSYQDSLLQLSNVTQTILLKLKPQSIESSNSRRKVHKPGDTTDRMHQSEIIVRDKTFRFPRKTKRSASERNLSEFFHTAPQQRPAPKEEVGPRPLYILSTPGSLDSEKFMIKAKRLLNHSSDKQQIPASVSQSIIFGSSFGIMLFNEKETRY